MDKKGYSPYYEHRLSADTLLVKTRVMIGNESGPSIRHSSRSPAFAYMFAIDGPVVFFRGRDEALLALPIYESTYSDKGLEITSIFSGLLPAENYYGSMETWQETLSPQYSRTSAHLEIGFYTVFGEVNPKWNMEWHMQLRRKHQVQRQIELLIFDMPDGITFFHECYTYSPAWKFIMPYMHEYHLTNNSFCGLWYNHPLEHLQCHMRKQHSEYYELLEIRVLHL